MRVLIRAPLWALVIFSFAGMSKYFLPEIPKTSGLDIWNIPELLSEMQADENKVKELSNRNQMFLESMQVKNELVEDLVRKKRPLLEVASIFSHVSKLSPHFQAAIQTHFPGMTKEESLCRHVIRYVENALGDRPIKSEVIARLETDLQRHLAAGTMSIPAIRD